MPRSLVVFLTLSLLVLPSGVEARLNKPAKGIAALSWLAGSWSGEHDGGIIEEHWTLPNGKSMVGMGRLVVDEKTVFWECLRIVERDDGGIVYIAQPGGRCPAVEFTLTSVEIGKAVFENPRHDDPKVIRYELKADGKTLSAVTEGDKRGKTIVHETQMIRTTLIP